MAAFQFPDPALQTTVTNPITGSTYQWKEPPGKWVVTVKMRDVGDIIWEGDNPPSPIGDYKLWYSTDTLELYFYYCDAAGTCAWVPTSVPIQVLEDLNAFAAQAEVDIDQLQYKQQLLQNAVDQIYLDLMTGGASARPPIFSDTEPTVHPDFAAPNNALVTGDTWFDTTDADQLIEYVYDGTQWIVTGNYVKKKGGDTMQGPLEVTGGRSPNAEGLEATVKTLNVDSGQSSTLNLKWDGNTKVYVGENDVTLVNDLKFNVGGKHIYAEGPNKKGLVVNKDGVFYDGNYTVDRHIVTKKNLEEAIFDDILDQDNTNKYVKRTGDSMSGQLEMVGNRIVFNSIPADSQVIRVNRSAGENVDLLYLAHNGGQQLGYYDIRMTGNTNYNGIRFKGGSGGDAPIFEMRANGNYNIFYSDLRFDGNRIRELGNAVEDTDAVPYGQLVSELQEFRDDLVQELSFGTWSYSSNNVTPIQSRFYVRGSNGVTSNVSASMVDTLIFNIEDLYGNVGPFDRVDIGELFTLSRDGIVLKYRVTSAPTTSGSQNDGRVIGVNFISQSQSVTLTESQVWNVQLTEFADISVDELDDTYLRLDTSNDPLENNLKIHSTDFGEAKLTLRGKRDNANNTCATIEFNNELVSDNTKIGYLTYYNFGDTQRFGFNHDVDLGGNTLKGVGELQIYNGGSIDAGSTKRILLQNPSQGGDGGDFGAVSIRRAVNWRRSFAIRGNVDGAEDDIFYANTTADGTDGVIYKGHTDFEYNILNRKALTEALDAFTPSQILKHTPYISNGSQTITGVYNNDVQDRFVCGFYTDSTTNGSRNQYVGNFNSYLKCGIKVFSTQAGSNSYADLPVGHDLEFSGIVTVLNRSTGGVLYKNTVTRVQCAQDDGQSFAHIKVWVRDYIGSPKGRKPMYAVGQVSEWTNISVVIEGYYLG